MMKLASKFALVAAVAALAIAGSTADSQARGKQMKMAAPAACMPGALKVANCSGTACTMQRCWADRKWHASMMMCWQPWCPK